MTSPLDQARSALQQAREALRAGNLTQARQWAERAAALAPQMEDPWLILAAVASPRASVEYIRTALKINPASSRARKGMEWALQRLSEAPAPRSTSARTPAPPVLSALEAPAPQPQPTGNRYSLMALVVFGLGCLLCAGALWAAGSSSLLPLLQAGPAAAPTHPGVWAVVNVPKPTYTPAELAQVQATATRTAAPAASLAPAPTATLIPTEMAAEVPTQAPLVLPTETAEPPTPAPTWSGSLSMSIVPDTPTSEVPTNLPGATSVSPGTQLAAGTRWIDVNLTQQMVYAYQGDTLANSFLVSTGTWQYPTVTGEYHIYVKLRYTDMTGPGYYLPNVPYTMYFYEGYGLHGTYWHHNFGTPMSHGCVNLSIPDSAWLYNWASVGTLVNIHY